MEHLGNNGLWQSLHQKNISRTSPQQMSQTTTVFFPLLRCGSWSHWLSILRTKLCQIQSQTLHVMSIYLHFTLEKCPFFTWCRYPSAQISSEARCSGTRVTHSQNPLEPVPFVASRTMQTTHFEWNKITPLRHGSPETKPLEKGDSFWILLNHPRWWNLKVPGTAPPLNSRTREP